MDANGYETRADQGRSEADAGRTKSRRLVGGWFVTALCWLAAAGVFAASAARLLTSGDTGAVAWLIDAIAIMTAQTAIAAGMVAIVALLLRRRGAAALSAMAAVVAFSGVALATRADRLGAATPPANGPDGCVVRVLVANTLVFNERSIDVAAMLDTQEVEAAIVLETHEDLMQLFRDPGRPIRKRLPYVWIPPENWKGFWYLFTKWPQRGGAENRVDPHAGYTDQPSMSILSVVERPSELGGPFVMVAMHLFSPHTIKARDDGNDMVRHYVTEVAARAGAAGLPAIVGGDFNCSPTGWRSRELTRDASEGGGGLRRAKPWTIADGTRPGGSTWPFSVAIDDVFVSPGVNVISWKTVTIPGSDHDGVVVELWVPKGK